MYPLSLYAYESPTCFSEATPRGHALLTAWRMPGVNGNGGSITRSWELDGNEMANSMGPGCGRVLAEALGLGTMGNEELSGAVDGREKAIATRSSCSLAYSMVERNENPSWKMVENMATMSLSDARLLIFDQGFLSRENSKK